MIEINVVTPEGQLFSEQADMIIARNEEGEMAILKDHLPIVVAIDPGYIRLQRDDKDLYITIVGGFLEFSNNLVSVIAQEAEIGRDPENALRHLAELRRIRADENKRKNVDFTKAERELKKNIKDIGAGEYM